MRILALAPGHAYGGAEVVMRYVLDEAVERGDEVFVGAATAKVLERFAPFPKLALGISPEARWRGVDAAVRITAICRRESIDLIYSCHRWPTLLARPAARILKVPVVYHCQSHVAPRRGTWWGDWTIAVSRAVKEAAIAGGARADRVRLVPNPANTDAPEPEAVRQAREQVVAAMPDAAGGFAVAVARLVAGKGVDVLLGALSRMSTGSLVVVGDGEERPALEQLAARLGVTDRVLFVGWKPDPRPYVAAGQLFVFPTDTYPEGLPLAMLDAMAVGRPVVATRVGGVDEVVEDGETGLTVPPGDELALAQAMQLLQVDAGLRDRLGARGRELAESSYAASTITSRVLKVFDVAVSERP